VQGMIKVAYLDINDRYKCMENKTVVINQQMFPDGTLLLKTDEVTSCYGNVTIIWNYENDSELFIIICLAKKFKNSHLIMPYVPHARMDRCKTKEDTFTLKYFAEIINSLNFKSVKVLDPHSPVCEALIDNIFVESPKKHIDKVINEKFLDDISLNKFSLFFPDEGSMKRYSGMFNNPYTFGVKKRDWKTGKIQGLDVIGDETLIKDKTILIVDDICSKGGTFYHAAEKLKELGAKEVYLYVTHCENTILDGKVLTSGLIEKVFTTNSIFTKEHEKIEVYNLD
jgi:ribose-phosphate pyrophosphokinase